MEEAGIACRGSAGSLNKREKSIANEQLAMAA
jgi:hypothetical protein